MEINRTVEKLRRALGENQTHAQNRRPLCVSVPFHRLRGRKSEQGCLIGKNGQAAVLWGWLEKGREGHAGHNGAAWELAAGLDQSA